MNLQIVTTRTMNFNESIKFFHGSNSCSLEGVASVGAILCREDLDKYKMTPMSGESGYTLKEPAEEYWVKVDNTKIRQGVSLYPSDRYSSCLHYANIGTESSLYMGFPVFPILYGIRSISVESHSDHYLSIGSILVEDIVNIFLPKEEQMNIAKKLILSSDSPSTQDMLRKLSVNKSLF